MHQPVFMFEKDDLIEYNGFKFKVVDPHDDWGYVVDDVDNYLVLRWKTKISECKRCMGNVTKMETRSNFAFM